ncbi:MAG TPA: PIG-L family deacetylase [Chloroflexi bacterium]|nr:PIG-L family deacetylase [Chloroflexota bacterium]
MVSKAEYDHLYLSPHLDDVVLSCGGLIRKQTLAGERVLVVTLFAGIPSYERLSLFARFLHFLWGRHSDPVGHRRQEDRAALSRLGADPLHLDFLEAIYRGALRQKPSGQALDFLYRSNRALFGAIDPQDEKLHIELASAIEEVVKRQGKPLLYAPLAVGHHVDHRIARRAADSLRRRGYPVTYYEDFPYAKEEEALLLALGAREEWSPTLEGIAETIEEKIEAIALYASQIFVLFRRKKTMERRMRAYASSLAPERGPCERYWKPA